MSDTILPNDGRMKPILVVPPDTMSDADIAALKENGLCVVVAKDPAGVKFLDPIPSGVGRERVEQAAIDLSRKLLSREGFASVTGASTYLQHGALTAKFVELLVRGSPLDPLPSVNEIQRQEFDRTKLDEVRKIAREEAREEAAARKAAKKAAQK